MHINPEIHLICNRVGARHLLAARDRFPNGPTQVTSVDRNGKLICDRSKLLYEGLRQYADALAMGHGTEGLTHVRRCQHVVSAHR